MSFLGFVVTMLLPSGLARAGELEPLEAFDGGQYDLAFGTWLSAAMAGEVDAQLAVAGLYATGLGTEHSEEAAFEWYRRAARQGHPIAAANLAERYARGDGVEPTPVLAFGWLEIARRLGNSWAAEQRKIYIVRLNPDQLRSAFEFAEAFTPVLERAAP